MSVLSNRKDLDLGQRIEDYLDLSGRCQIQGTKPHRYSKISCFMEK